LADLHIEAADVRRDLSDWKGSLQDASESLRLDCEIESTTKSVPTVIRSLATSYAAVGMAEANLSRVNDSLDNYLRGASELQKLVASNPRSVSWNRELMLAYGHAADVSGNPGLQNLGVRKAALTYYQRQPLDERSAVLADGGRFHYGLGNRQLRYSDRKIQGKEGL
jgi:hypothetical protein